MNFTKKRLHKGSRVHLKPLIEKQLGFFKIDEVLQASQSREHIFSSPQPIKLNLDQFVQIGKKQDLGLSKLKIVKKSNFKSSMKNSPIRKSDTPPYIKKIEKFWEKIGKIKEFNLDNLPQGMSQRIKVSNSVQNGKKKIQGVPARYKELVLGKSNTEKEILNRKTVEKDLFIIKINNGIDIAERVKVAKLTKLHENANKEGILKKKNIEDNWIWYTPKGTPSDKTVRFDFNN